MKTSLIAQDGLKRKLEFTVPKENVQNSFVQNIDKYQKSAEIPGFRKGKVPKDKVKVSHRGKIWKSVMDQLFSQFYPKVLNEHKLNPAGQPKLLDIKLAEEQPCVFTIEVEVHPKIKCEKYQKLKISKKDTEVTGKQVDDTLNKLRDSFATYKGKEKILPEMNEEFLTRFKVKTIEDLKDNIKKDLKALNEQQAKEAMENNVIEALVKENPLSLPETLVEERKKVLMKNAQDRLKEYGGLNPQDQQEWLKEREQKFEEEARFSIHSGYLLETLIKDLKIQLSEKDIEDSLKESFPSKKPDEMKQELKKHQHWNYFIFSLTRKKVIDYLIKEADIS